MWGACEMSIWLCASVLLVMIKLDEPVGRKRPVLWGQGGGSDVVVGWTRGLC